MFRRVEVKGQLCCGVRSSLLFTGNLRPTEETKCAELLLMQPLCYGPIHILPPLHPDRDYEE